MFRTCQKSLPRAISSINHCTSTLPPHSLRLISFGQSGVDILLTMSTSLSRAVLRRSVKLPGGRANVRFESTSSKAAEAAKDAAAKGQAIAQEYSKKASEGLSRVSSAAGPAISNATKNLGAALGKVGGRTGKFIAFVERQIPPTIYYAKVGLELSKLVFQGQKMSPPPLSTFEAYFQRILTSAQNPKPLLEAVQKANAPQDLLQRVRNLSRAQIVSGAVIGAELLGFFTVGEMIGRFKLVGYRGDKPAHH